MIVVPSKIFESYGLNKISESRLVKTGVPVYGPGYVVNAQNSLASNAQLPAGMRGYGSKSLAVSIKIDSIVGPTVNLLGFGGLAMQRNTGVDVVGFSGSSTVGLHYYNSNSYYGVSANLPLGRWNRLALVWENMGTYMAQRTFLNGVQLGSSACPAVVAFQSGNLVLGRGSVYTGWNGSAPQVQLKDVTLWSWALNATNVRGDFAAKKKGGFEW